MDTIAEDDAGTAAYLAVKQSLTQLGGAETRVARENAQRVARSDVFAAAAATQERSARMLTYASTSDTGAFGELDLGRDLEEPSMVDKLLDAAQSEQHYVARLERTADRAMRAVDAETETLFAKYGVPRLNAMDIAALEAGAHTTPEPYAKLATTVAAIRSAPRASYKPTYTQRYEEYLATRPASKSLF